MGNCRRRLRPGIHSIASAFVALWWAAAAGGCGVLSTSPAAGTFKPVTPGVLTVVTSEIPTPGFWTGTPVRPTGGFEYALAQTLAKRLGLHAVRVRIEPFRCIVAGELPRADLALDLITPTSQRESKLDFSTAYYTGPPAVVVRNGTRIPDLKTAESLRWGAIRATTFVGDIRALVAPSKPIVIFDDVAQMLRGLRDDQIDAAIFDLPLAVVISTGSHGVFDVAAQLPASELIAAALPKGSGNVQAVDSAINAFTADGIIQRLLDRWVGSSVTDASVPLLHTTR